MIKIMVEVVSVEPRIFFKYYVKILKIEASCNNWFDMTIQGEKANLICLLYELGFGDTDEAMEYINQNQV